MLVKQVATGPVRVLNEVRFLAESAGASLCFSKTTQIVIGILLFSAVMVNAQDEQDVSLFDIVPVTNGTVAWIPVPIE